MEIKTLAKNTMILASPKVLKFIVGLLKSKFLAIFLGTVGFGLVDQLLNSISQFRKLTLSFLPDGMVKLIAQENSNESNPKNIASIIKTYFAIVTPLALICTFIGYFFADELTVFIFGDIQYKIYFLIGYSALPITIFSASFRSFLKAYKEIRSFALTEFYVIIVNFIIFLPLVYFYGVTGGIIYATLTFFVTFCVVIILVRKNVFKKYKITFNLVRKGVFKRKYSKELFSFIGVGLISGLFRVFENIATRSIVVNEIGVDQLGIYAPITKWGNLFIGFILPAIYTYLYPRLSEAKSNTEITNVINDVVRLVTFIVLPFVIIGISTRDWIIPLFYSYDFIDAAKYLPYHFSFLLIAVWGTIFEQIFAPTGRLKVFLIFIIITSSISLFLVYFLVPSYGLYGYLIRFTIAPFITLIIFFFFWKKEINFKLQKLNWKIIIYALFCTLIMLFIKNLASYIQLITGLLLISLMIPFLNFKEKNFLMKKIKSFLPINK